MKQTTLLIVVFSIGLIGCEKPPSRREQRHTERVGSLAKALRSESHAEGVKAAETLANLGDRAAGSASALVEALGAENAELRAHAARTLGKVFQHKGNSTPEVPDTVVPALRKSLEDDNALVRVWTALALFKIQPQADLEIKVLTDLLEKPGKALVRVEAAVAIVEMGPRAKDAVPALITALKSQRVSRHAAYALGAIGPDAGEAIPELTKLSGRSGAAADAARAALEQIRQ